MVYTVSIDTTTNRISYENHDSDHGFQNLQRYFLQKSSVTAVRPEPQNYYITSSIALGDLEKIRLKPWFGMKVFGSAVCPTRSSAKDLHSNRGENNTFVVWDTLEHRYSPEVCPKFTPCLGSVMPDISFCQLPWIKSGLVSERIRPPLLIISSKISFSTELSFDRFTLPWLAHVASVNRGVFVNVFGHIFSETRQYLHGGCQV
jgi:hypothetical protein